MQLVSDIRNNWKYFLVISVITFLVSLVRFGYIYPDSEHYLDFVDFLRGQIEFSDTRTPFTYRPLLPLIAAIFPINPILSFGIINQIFIMLLGCFLFLITMEFDIDPLSSLFSSLLCSVSLVIAFYGAAVIVDPGAMLCVAISLLMLLRNEDDWKIALVLSIGILFKEIVIVGIIAFVLYRRKIFSLTTILPASIYIVVRFLMSSGTAGYIWTIGLWNIIDNIESTSKTMLFGFGPFIPFLIIGLLILYRKLNEHKNISKWILITLLGSTPYFLMGLFMASFDVRFVWPLYFAFHPLAALGFTKILNHIPYLHPPKTIEE